MKLDVPTMPRPKRDDIAVKIAAPVYRKAKMIAAHRDITIAEYLSHLLEKPIERDYTKMLQELSSDQASGEPSE